MLCLATTAEAAKPTIPPPDRAKIGAAGTGFRDAVRQGHAARRLSKATLHAADSGGNYPVGNGKFVRVLESSSYTPDDEFNQAWADFFASLVHGNELSRVTIYFAPYDEMIAMCGDGTDACYFPDDEMVVLTGDPLPDGSSTEEAAAHEYGHHVAQNRRNDVGPAGDWGPEYWATYEHICELDGTGAFPGDEGAHYDRNPGEAWAETFRVLNTYNAASWPIIAPVFRPDQRALALARRDVVNPYRGGEYVDRGGRFKKKGSRWRNFYLPVDNDGTVDLRLKGGGSLDADIYVYTANGRRRIAKSTRTGHREHYTGTYCGYRKLDVAVYRYSGTGSFSLRATLPFFSTAP